MLRYTRKKTLVSGQKTKTKHADIRELSSPWLVQSESCLVRELTSPRVVQSMSWQSASWPVTRITIWPSECYQLYIGSLSCHVGMYEQTPASCNHVASSSQMCHPCCWFNSSVNTLSRCNYWLCRGSPEVDPCWWPSEFSCRCGSRAVNKWVSVLKLICNDFLVVKVNCWSYVFNIIRFIWILRNIKNKKIVQKSVWKCAPMIWL